MSIYVHNNDFDIQNLQYEISSDKIFPAIYNIKSFISYVKENYVMSSQHYEWLHNTFYALMLHSFWH